MTLEEEYLAENSLSDLAKKYNVSPIAIWKRLKKDGVKLRPQGSQTQKSKKKIQDAIRPKWKETCKKISESNKGEKNGMWKDGAFEHNKKIINETFKKYNSICQDCNLTLFREKKNTWECHHIDMKLKYKDKKLYMLSKDRILLCVSCHKKRHLKYTEIIIKGLKQGWSGYKIKKEYGLNGTTIQNYIKKYNLLNKI